MHDIHLQKMGILIPAYQPTPILVQLIADLSPLQFGHIVIVNDGSDVRCNEVFSACSQYPYVTVLTHEKNQGKGAALRTGMRWLIENSDEQSVGIVTVDADGQHLTQDIEKIAHALLDNPQQLILGTRRFDQSMPWRSRFGNNLTRKLFRWRYGIDIRDTQTGLRGIPKSLMAEYLAISAQRYEYEMVCLIFTVKTHYPISQIDINTVYIEKNISSHFRPVVDSMRIYYVFLRFIIISFISFLIDLSIFVTLHYLSQSIFFSLLVARFSSSTFNFLRNKFTVYRSNQLAGMHREIVIYIIWAVSIFFISYLGIKFFIQLGMSVIPAKILIDCSLFLFNFIVQKMLVFRGGDL